MSATIHYSFAPECAVMTGAHFDADEHATYRAEHPDTNVPGQLWERVAEGTPRTPGTRHDYGYWIARASERGPRLSDMVTTAGKFSSGIIRAGERVK